MTINDIGNVNAQEPPKTVQMPPSSESPATRPKREESYVGAGSLEAASGECHSTSSNAQKMAEYLRRVLADCESVPFPSLP